MHAFGRTLNVAGIMLALVVVVLAAQPAAAEPNNGSPTYRDRIDAARSGCKNSGGTFSMTIEVSQGRAHTSCAEKDGSTTNCTLTMSSSECSITPPPPKAAQGSAGRRQVGDIGAIDVEITSTDAVASPYAEVSVEDGPVLTVADVDDPATSFPQPVDAEPAAAQPVEVEPIAIEAIEDDDA